MNADFGTNSSLSEKLRTSKKHQRYLGLFALIATALVISVALALRQPGAALTRIIEVLDCPYDGVAAHYHDNACYDDEGNLVCEMPELELHEHDENCYDEDGELICDQEEVLESHQHGPGCFTTITVYEDDGDEALEIEDDEALESEDEALESEDDGELLDSADDADESAATYPARVFSHDFTDGEDRLVLRVDVTAPEGALPA